MVKKKRLTERTNSYQAFQKSHTTKLYHRKESHAMFEFEIILQKDVCDEKNPVVKGQATGCINDHLATVIKTEDGIKWMQIGNVVVPLYRIEAIKTTGVSL